MFLRHYYKKTQYHNACDICYNEMPWDVTIVKVGFILTTGNKEMLAYNYYKISMSEDPVI